MKIAKHFILPIVFLVFSSFNSFSQDTCHCKSYASIDDTVLRDFPAVVFHQSFSGVSISVCGEKNKFTENAEGYFYVEVMDCGISKVISDFWEEDVYKIVSVKDTVSLYYRDGLMTIKGSLDLKAGYPFRVAFFEQDSQIKSRRMFSESFRFYNRKQLKMLKKEYMKFSMKTLAPEHDLEILGTLSYHLAMGAISGDMEAEKRLLNFAEYYGELHGAHAETINYGIKAYNLMRRVEMPKKRRTW